MRTITDALQGVYNADHRKMSVWFRAEIDRTGSGDWVDLTTLGGHNWITSWDYGESLDSPASDGTLVLQTQTEDNRYNLSPLMANNPANDGGVLLQPARLIRFSTATVPHGYVPLSTDYAIVFQGKIFGYELTPSGYQVRCTGRGDELHRKWIENETEYGDDGGSLQLEDVIQDILDDWSSGTTLYSANGTSGTPFAGGDSPGWAIKRWSQVRQPLLEALLVLSDQIGYTLRYRYHEGSGINDFVLVLEEADRTQTLVDFTIPIRWQSVQSFGVDLDTIRNVWRVVYQDSSGIRQTSETSDATSITKYGRLWAEYQAESSDQIDTSTEADALRDAALADTKDPTAMVQLQIPYFMPVQLNDLYRLTANGILWDTDQDMGVDSIRHSGSVTSNPITTLGLSGKPKAHIKWAARQKRHPRTQTRTRNVLGQQTVGTIGFISNSFCNNWGGG